MTSALPPLIGESAAFSQVLEKVSRLAPIVRPVLVIGERGTGKELIAARLHFLSPRWDRPLVKLNCGALNENLLDSELFGHEAGAFTGAARRRQGRFELADGGTLFLDEIGNAPVSVQERILRAVEYGTFDRLGGETVQTDVRLIAATNVDLRAAVRAGSFRADLLDRLAFDVLTIPPLRARREDIPMLADHFGRAIARELRWPLFPGFTAAAMRALCGHDWPGNVRELRNTVERSVAQAEASRRPIAQVIFDPFDQPGAPIDRARDAAELDAAREGFDAAVLAFERRLLERALSDHGRRQNAAAAALGLGYHRFRHLLRRHGILGVRKKD